MSASEQNKMVPVDECPVCGSRLRRRKYSIQRKDLFYPFVYTITHLGPNPPLAYHIDECLVCGHWYVNPRLSLEEIIASYPPERFTQGVGYAPFSTLKKGAVQAIGPRNSGASWSNTWNERAQKLASLDLPEKSVLDVGCADGAFLRHVPESWTRCGIDNSDGAIQLGRQISDPSIDLICDELTTFDWKGRKFGAITAFDVLEHVIDPNSVVGAIAKLMQPGGHFWLSTPCAESPGALHFGKRWAMLTPAVHLHFYTRKGIEILLNQHGFEIVECRIGRVNLKAMLKTKYAYWKRRVAIRSLTSYGFASEWLNRLANRFNVLDDRKSFLRKLANINSAESLRPRFDDDIVVIARYKGKLL